jgi:methyl-accepting chemotaxis protein
MPVPPIYSVALQTYRVPEVDRHRAEIWKHLEPELGAIIDAHLERSLIAYPLYAERIRLNRERLKQSYLLCTERLFTQPFDEKWADAVKDRVSFELEMGYDMRVRPAINSAITTGLLSILSRRCRFSGQKVARLADTAMRVFSLDNSLSVGEHYAHKITNAKNRAKDLQNAIEVFEAANREVTLAMREVIDAISSATCELKDLAAQAFSQVETAAEAAVQSSSYVSTTVTSIEELTTSIADIDRRAIDTLDKAESTAKQTETSARSVSTLSETTSQIGSIVGTISRIAGQTNLLALNATIEAARAGEAGRGFAVVANEVKNLAVQTEKATREIGVQIARVQEMTLVSANSIASASERVAEIADISKILAVSVNEQAAASNSIAETIHHVADEAAKVSTALEQIKATVDSAQHTTTSLMTLSDRLSERKARLGSAVSALIKAAAESKASLRGFSDLQQARSA